MLSENYSIFRRIFKENGHSAPKKCLLAFYLRVAFYLRGQSIDAVYLHPQFKRRAKYCKLKYSCRGFAPTIQKSKILENKKKLHPQQNVARSADQIRNKNGFKSVKRQQQQLEHQMSSNRSKMTYCASVPSRVVGVFLTWSDPISSVSPSGGFTIVHFNQNLSDISLEAELSQSNENFDLH